MPTVDDLIARAAALRVAGRLDDAAAELAAMAAGGAQPPALTYQMALIEADRGRWDAAVRLALDAAAAGGDAYAQGAGWLLAKAGRPVEAQAWLERALARDADDVTALACLGALHGDARRFDEALRCIERALVVRPDFPWARACRDRLRSDQQLLASVEALLAGWRRQNTPATQAGPDDEIEIPSAFVDARGQPRFRMWLPAARVGADLGAAQLFRQEVSMGGYEFPLRRFLDLHLRSDDIFVDVGAHWGIHALTAATRWPGQVSVLAIEGFPGNAARLASWVARNGVGADIETIAAAVGDRVGTATMRTDAGSSMGHSLLGHDGGTGAGTPVEVPVTTIDRLLDARPQLRWRRIVLKLDVEGCEWEALAGARATLSSGNVAAVIWENSHFHAPDEQRRRTRDVVELLTAHGFAHHVVVREGPGIHVRPLQDLEAAGDVFSLAPGCAAG